MATGTIKQTSAVFNMNNVTTFSAFRPSPYIIDSSQVQHDKPLYLSTLGTPVYTDLTFERVKYSDKDGVKIVPEIVLQTVLITVSRPKNIIRTGIAGGDATVVEYIGNGDHQITINGIIVGPNGKYPKDEVAALKKMFDAPRPIPVVSWYLQNLDIYDIIVEDYAFGQDPGRYSEQVFTMNCTSFNPVIIQIS